MKKIKESEVVCTECNGKGYMQFKKHKKSKFFTQVYCEECEGSGKLDWIENIVGKRQESLYWFPAAGFKRRKKYPKLIAKDILNVQPIFKKEK